ncbi:MAG: glutamate-5-semialdehyde dehydrogenase, partial [Rhodospirillales bacterium]|nr:glutamate-5-semialdehyde dehydrogenase [Rhodospirillales bacterium]
ALVDLKAVDGNYPMLGAVMLTPAMPVHDLLAERDGAFGAGADAVLLARLGLNPGDRITVGNATFEVRATVVSEPDKLAGGVGLGPRLLVSERALRATGLPEAAIQVAPTTDRAYVAAMLGAAGLIDLIIPRGGKSLVERVQREARVPVLAHAEGLNHTYVHAAADPDMARRVVANAKMRRTGVCGATETLLIDRAIAPTLLPSIVADLAALGCTFRADAAARAVMPELPAAAAADFDTEWLDAVISVAVVDGVDAALAHIARHGSEHTDAIITEDAAVAEHFLASVDSAVSLWNASTQFCDGGEFGFGAEIGIATGHIHARGPVGLEQLTTYRYQVFGAGQVRP